MRNDVELLAALRYAASNKRNGKCGFITVTDPETALLVSTVISLTLSNFFFGNVSSK